MLKRIFTMILLLCALMVMPVEAAEGDMVSEITIATQADSSITFTLTNVSGYCSDEKGLNEGDRRIVVFFTNDSFLTCNTDMLEKVGASSMEAYFFPEYLGANLDARLEEGLVRIIPAGTSIKISDMSEDGIRGRAIQLPNGHEIKLDPTEDIDFYKDHADYYELIPISALSVVESVPSSTPEPTPAPAETPTTVETPAIVEPSVVTEQPIPTPIPVIPPVTAPVVLPAPVPVFIPTPVTLPTTLPISASAVIADEDSPFPIGSTAVIDNCYFLNVRRGPGASHAAFTSLAKGDVITVLDYNQNKWVKIDTTKGQGWIYGGYLTRQ